MLDVIFLIAMFAVSIAAAVAESKKYKLAKKGAFGVAAAFGFIACILYIVIIVFSVLESRKSRSAGVSSPSSGQDSRPTNA